MKKAAVFLCLQEPELYVGSFRQPFTACVSSVCVAEEYTCLWQECGFCSPESSADLVRHVYFHCYHTKLKQWGLRALQSQSDVSHCQLDFQSRNIIPEIQENFLCLWEYCEVRAGDRFGFPPWLLAVMWSPEAGKQPTCTPACWLRS